MLNLKVTENIRAEQKYVLSGLAGTPGIDNYDLITE